MKGSNTPNMYVFLISNLLALRRPYHGRGFPSCQKPKKKIQPSIFRCKKSEGMNLQRTTGFGQKTEVRSGCHSKPLAFIILPTKVFAVQRFPYAWTFFSAIKDAHQKYGSHWRFRLHLPGYVFETLLLFLWDEILQVVRWWMQISQCEYEPINQQPHFMRLQPPNCFVSAANYFWEIFLHIEKESVIIIECTAKQKFCCKYIKGRDHIFSTFYKLP